MGERFGLLTGLRRHRPITYGVVAAGRVTWLFTPFLDTSPRTAILTVIARTAGIEINKEPP